MGRVSVSGCGGWGGGEKGGGGRWGGGGGGCTMVLMAIGKKDRVVIRDRYFGRDHRAVVVLSERDEKGGR